MKTDDRRPLFRRSLAGVVLAAVLLALWGAATHGSLPSGSTEPAIASLTPESGPEGMVVTIGGSNFGPSIGAVQGTSGVSFNGVWATPSSWSDTEIRVAVPPGAATGPVVVTVSGQPSAGVEFTVTGTGGSGPAIGTVSPALGPEGTLVTVRGANFGPTADMGGVSFNGVWASVSNWSDTEIRVPVPADAMIGSVVVTVNGQASNGVAFIVTDSGLGEPAIDSLSAVSGPEGMVVRIEGENFGSFLGTSQGTSGVSFNGVWASPTYWSETQIQVPVPARAPSGLVTVAVGGEASNGLAFVVERPAPLIEAVDSSFGPEGATVEISGRNFGPAMEASQGWSGVSFDGLWGMPTYWSDREIHVSAPAGVSGGLIVVTSVGQASNGIPFTVARSKRMPRAVAAASTAPRAAPVITKLKPATGAVEAGVKIKGSNFGDERDDSTVTFNGTEVRVYDSWGDTKIDVEVPGEATTGPVVVTVGGVVSNGVTFTVTGSESSAPTISSLEPDSGPEGTSIVITGANFGALKGTSTVAFNGMAATPTNWSDTSITVAVPMGAATGDVVVTVDGTPSSGVSFTVAPAIGSLSPDAGPEGATVEITGTSFGTSQGTSTVTFNGTGATPTSWSDTSITVTVPAGATTGSVVVTVGGTPSDGASFTVTPAIGSLSPIAGPEGTTVEITGMSFGAMQGTSSVTFNGTPVATYTSWSDTSITVTVPVGATTGNVVVTVGGEASNGVSFAVGTDPVISGLNPDSGPAGTTVEITGANFGASQGTSSVTFNGAGATPANWSDTSITVAVPANATTGPVVVTVDGTASNAMTFSVKPVVGGLSRVSGPEGATVEITGTGFGPSQGTSTVTFNGAGATPTNWSDTSITVTVPAGAATGSVVVTVGGTPSDGVSFTVTPAIGSLSPIAGPEGATVEITGTSFGASQGTSTVTFNGTGATPTRWSGTSITVTVPTGATTGPVVVTVAGQASNGVSFTVGTDPIVTSLSPALGQVETTVVIGGANFGASQGAGTVTFNGVAATATSWSDTSITVTVPATAATGPVVVTVGGEASNQVTFTVTGPPPVINKLKPGEGGVGDSVKVKGEHFGTARGTSKVTFNGEPAISRKWDDDKITVNVPAGARTGPVVVTVEGQASNPVTFSVTGSSPSIISLDPTLGEVDTSVTITGVHFGATKGASTVTFNGVTVATYTSWSDTGITVPVPATAATGPVVVTVGGQVSNGVTFTVTVPAPSITGLNPTEGRVGASVAISGENFGASRGTSAVTFNGTPVATYTIWSDTSITVTVPTNATTGSVVVTVGGQVSNGVEFTVDETLPGVTVTETTLDVVEGNTGTYQVKLDTEPGASVTVTPASSEMAVATVSPPTLTFTTSNWNVAQEVTVTGAQDDDGVNGTATITHTAESTDTGYNDISPIGSVVVSVEDNDPFGVTVTKATLEVVEGNTGTYQVKLDTKPSANVTVTPASGDTDVATVSPPPLTFTTDNWNMAQEVTVSGEQDDDGVDGTATITHTATSTDSDYEGISPIGSVVVSVEDDDPFGVTVTEAALDVTEGSTATYQVKLDTKPSANVTVSIAEASDAISVSSSSLIFTTSNWNVAQEVTVSGEQDDDTSDEEATITHTATSTDSDYEGISPIGSVVVSVEDKDHPQITLSSNQTSISEPSGTATITASVLSGYAPEADLAIALAYSGTAAGGTDYSVGTLTILAGQISGEATLSVTDDSIDEDEETIALTGSAAGYEDSAALSIALEDDDTAGLAVSTTQLDINEGADGQFQVKLDTEPLNNVTVSIAEASDAISVSSGSLTFTSNNWSTYKTVTVTGLSDSDYADETATITTSATSSDPKYNTTSLNQTVEVTVGDNENPPITLSSGRTSVSEPSGTATITARVPSGNEPEADLTITLVHSGTAGSGTDYSVGALAILAGQASGEATLSVTDDSIDEDEETIGLKASASGYAASDVLSIALEDDGDMAGLVVSTTQLDINEGVDGQFQVKLNSEPLNNVTVTVAEASEAISVSSGALTFTSSNWSVNQTVTVTGLSDDDYADGTGAITVSATSSDAKYNTTSLNQTVSVSVRDDEDPPITLTSNRTSVSEPSGTATITASVPVGYEPDAALTITLAHSGTAGSGTDYAVGALTIQSGQTSGEATLSVADDSIDEDEETIALTGSAAGYRDSLALSIALEDDDTAGLVVSTASLDVDEGGTGQFQVKLNSEPLNNVTVTVAEASEAISVSDTSLTFTSSNWSVNQTVTVTGLSDDDYADGTGAITASATSSDAKYNTASLNQSVSVRVDDDEHSPITLTSNRTSVSEPSGTDTITASVPVGYEPDAALTITLAHSGTAGSGTDYAVGALTIQSGQTSGEATLSVADDSIDEDEETIALTGSAAGYRDSLALSIALEDDDTAGLVVSTASLDVDEGGTGQFQVKLNSEPLNNVTVTVAEASEAISVSDTSLTFTSSNWSTNQTVTVTGLSDDDYTDGTGAITVSATSSDAKYNTASLNQSVSVAVDDDEYAPITLSSNQASVSEPSGTATITARVPAGYAPGSDTTVTLTRSGSAGSSDYTLGALTILAGQTSGEATLTVTDDQIDEGAETIGLKASASGYAASDVLSIPLNDDDTAGLVVSTSSLDITEGNDGTYRVKLNSRPTHSVTVSFWMSLDSSSTVSVPTGSLTFTTSNWNTYKTVTVETAEDNSDYDNETATIINSPSSSDTKYNASLDEDVRVSVTDDDTPPLALSCPPSVSEPSGTGTIRVSRPSGYRPSGSTTVSLGASGSAIKGTDYRLGSMSLSIPGGQGSDSTTLTVIDDRIDEDAKSIRLTASASGYVSDSCSITLNDNDEARLVVTPTSLTIGEAMSDKYTVRLNSKPTADVTVSVSETSDDITRSPASLTFTSNNWSTNQTVTVRALQDDDCANESATVSNKPTSTGDPKYNKPESLKKTVAVTVIDDESNTIALSSSPTSVSEASGSGTATITATLGCTSSDEQTINLSDLGTADEGTNKDYTVGTLTVNAGQLSGTATLTVRDDHVAEGTETITMGGSTGGYSNSSNLSITLIDNDMAGLVVEQTSLTIDEGMSGQYTVRLKSEPTATVTVSVSETSDDITRSPASLTFTTSNWSTKKTVTVDTVEDSDCADESATVGNRSSSSDLMYSGLSVNVNVTVIDDESPTITLTSSPTSVSEPSGTATITATLGCTSSDEQTINLSDLGTADEGTNKDYTVGTLTVNAGQLSGTATLTVRDDHVAEGTETITMGGSTGGYSNSSNLSITLIDNDMAGLVVEATSLTINEGMGKNYTVKLKSKPTASVTVSVSTTSSKIDAAATLTFTTSNWDTEKTVTVSALSDDDCANESATVSNKPTSTGDPKYNKPERLKKTVAVTVIDDESNTIALSSSPTSVSEPSGTATITATLGCTSSSNKTIELDTSGTADEDDDYTVGDVTVSAGLLTGTTTLTVNDDDVCEGTETIKLTGSTSGYTNSPEISISLNDNDTAGIVVSTTSLTITEGNDGTYDVKLNSQPTHSVSVSFSVSGSSTVTVPTSSRTFTTSNWNTYQTVTVRPAEDDSDYSNESATVTNSATSSDSKYNTTNLNKTVSVSVTDDDTAPPATPSITSIRPPLQRPDDPVTIYGNHFGSTAGSVSFGGDSISIFSGPGYSWSNTSISLLIPGSLYAGPVSVSVTTNGGSTSNSYSYTVTGGPVNRGDCEEEGEDCPGDDKPKKGGSGGDDSEESEDPPGDGG